MADVNFKTTFGNDPNEEIAKDTSIIFVQQVLREYDSAPEFEGLKTNLLKLRETENLSIKDFNERYYNIVSDFYEKHYNDENMSEAMKKRLDVLYRYAEGLNSKDFKLNAKDFEFSVDEEHRKSAYISKQLGSNDAVAVVKPEAMSEILQEKNIDEVINDQVVVFNSNMNVEDNTYGKTNDTYLGYGDYVKQVEEKQKLQQEEFERKIQNEQVNDEEVSNKNHHRYEV